MRKIQMTAALTVLLLATSCGGHGKEGEPGVTGQGTVTESRDGQQGGTESNAKDSGSRDDAGIDGTEEAGRGTAAQDGGGQPGEPDGTGGGTQDGNQGGGREASQEEGTLYGQVRSQLDWSRGPCLLEDVTALLDGKGLPYEGYYNGSGERLDMVWEDGTALMFLAATDDMDNPKGTELMMVNNGRFNDSGFQEDYLNHYDVDSDEEYYPQTAGRLLEEQELWGMDQTELSIARNELFARHGRKFEDPFLKAVFSRKNWYRPRYGADEFSAMQDRELNDYEKANLKAIIGQEEIRRYRIRSGGDYRQLRELLPGSWLDLDGDGKKEQVKYGVQQDAGSYIQTAMLEVDGSRVEESGENVDSKPYTASLDGKTIQLFICQLGDSDSPMADVYTYRQGKLEDAGAVVGDELEIMDGSLYSYGKMDFFQSFIGKRQYVFKDGVIKEMPRDFYEQGNEAKALAKIPLYAKIGGGSLSLVLMPGDEAVILGGDNKEWICIQKKDTQEKGWLRCDGLYGCILPDGTTKESMELFEGLDFFG